MKLNKKTERLIKRRAAEFKKLYGTHHEKSLKH